MMIAHRLPADRDYVGVHCTRSGVPYKVLAQQTQNICITFVQRWTNVEDVGPTLYKCYANVFCLLGYACMVHRIEEPSVRKKSLLQAFSADCETFAP